MQDFIIGQRWISDAETQLGLGTVIETDHRTVTLAFLAVNESRTYAKQTAPLSRVAFAAGDRVRSQQGWGMKIEAVEEVDGLFLYLGKRDDNGETIGMAEGQLDPLLQLNRPAERLFAGQVDPNKWFELRYQTLQHINRLAHSDLRGLTGSRTSLIPHQMYIAHEVANRYAPRVLLADEVGLGKTIEAGLILHHQLLTERAQRVLIVVPDSLVHQWLLEMLRRFNLHFSVFDEERCAALSEGDEETNPFQSEQLVLCSLGFLSSHPNRFKQAYLGSWDLLVVDEAHHLQWSPEAASLEYELIEMLASQISGVLLLTATPEQLGKAGHFARLRLLDPDRFPDFATFEKEEQGYEPIARAVEQLLSGEPLDEPAQQTLASTLDEGDNRGLLEDLNQTGSGAGARQQLARQQLVEHLLDRHGTGRVLFRNTRAAVKGFPQRHLHSYPLPMPGAYSQTLARLDSDCNPHLLLCPELAYQLLNDDTQEKWTTLDPRVEWLSQQLKTLRPAKVLVITANAHSAMDIAEALRVRTGIHAAIFHEQLSLIERDRAAAYFADKEYGSQVLICSEIGSEGRNFQFAHHMIMFDLPLNPDLLEQRIGRLDRIGQTQSIRIHVPYLEHSAQQLMLNWYHQGLSAFEHTCPAGHNVFVQVKEQLLQALHTPQADHSALMEQSAKLHSDLNEAMHRGRDRLLEYNSCRPHVAEQLCEQARQYDQQSSPMPYLEQIFDAYGVESEVHGEKSFVLHPGDHMQTSFPGLPEEGLTITYDRDTALANEDMQFISWEHPMLTNAMDMVLGNEQGNTAMASIKVRGLAPGSLLMECLFRLESSANTALQASRYLPPTTIRVVLDQSSRDLHKALPHEAINKVRENIDSETASTVVRAYKAELKAMLSSCEKLAAQQAPKILAEAHQGTRDTLQTEIDRLRALAQVNPNVRDDEIEFFSLQFQALTEVLDAASLRLEALRVLIST